MRVMHVVVAGDIGGAERLLVDLARRPEASGAEHEIALLTPNDALRAFFARAGLRVHDAGMVRESPVAYLRQTFGMKHVRWVAERLEASRADVVHTHTFGSHVLGTRAARRAGRPQVRTEHHVMHYFDPSCSPFTRWAAARTDRFVAISDYVLRVLRETAPRVAERTTVVRNGVDVDYWAPRPPPGEEAPFQVAVVCRLTAWKRVHVAIEAAALADVDLLIVGDGEERGKLEALARARGARARFVGHQDDPRPFVAACDATVSTSEDEPLGLSVLESLSMERPVIAYAGGGIPEIVQHDETGILVPRAEPALVADALRRAKNGRAWLRAMGPAARRFAVEHGSIDSMCRGYAAVYRDLARSP